MSDKSTLVQLKITPADFMATLLAYIPQGKIGWTSDNHYELFTQELGHLTYETGEKPSITPTLRNVLELIYKPSEDAERAVLRQAFADAGYVLETETEKLFVLMFSAAQFSDFLTKTNRPNTGSKFILKDESKKRGAKKDTFAALLTANLPTPGANSAGANPEPEASESSSESGTEVEETTQGEPAPSEEQKSTPPKKGMK